MEDRESRAAYTALVGRVSALIEVAKGWIRFCSQLNDEHQDEFKEVIITEAEMNRLQGLEACLIDFEEPHQVKRKSSPNKDDRSYKA